MCGCWDADHPIRLKAMWVCEQPLFENIVLAIIVANSAILAVQTPTGSPISPEMSERLELGFNVAFSIEMTIKICAMGFGVRPGMYLADGWNRLDFTVRATRTLLSLPPPLRAAAVAAAAAAADSAANAAAIAGGAAAAAAAPLQRRCRCCCCCRLQPLLLHCQPMLMTMRRPPTCSQVVMLGWAPYLVPSLNNLSAIRSLRALRPLRSINQLPGLRRQAKTLLDSLPKLSDVALLGCFMLALYGVLGLQVCAGRRMATQWT